MQVRALDFRDGCLRLAAPLSANVNDKACAFGGSLAGVMTLAGWGWLMLRAQAAGLASEVYVADSQVRYLKPLYADLVAEAWLEPAPTTLPDRAAFENFIACVCVRHHVDRLPPDVRPHFVGALADAASTGAQHAQNG